LHHIHSEKGVYFAAIEKEKIKRDKKHSFPKVKKKEAEEGEIEKYLEDIERIELEKKRKKRDKRRPQYEDSVQYTPEKRGYFSEDDYNEYFIEDLLSEHGFPDYGGEHWDLAMEKKTIRFAPDDWDFYNENEFQKGWDADSTPKHKHFVDYERGEVKLRVYGTANVKASYGISWFLSEKDKTNPMEIARARKITDGFLLDMGHTLHIRGIIGRKVTVKADIESGRAVDDWEIKYTGDQREFIDYARIGNFPLKFGNTEFLVWEKSTRRTTGAEAKMSRGKISFHVVATLTKGEQDTKVFRGQTQEAREVIRDYRYIRRKYYQLEPYCAYDYNTIPCSSSPPSINSSSYNPNLPNSGSNNLITLTSTPHPSRFTSANPWRRNPNVGINENSLEVWLDDNRPGETTKQIGSLGYFRRLRDDEFIFNGKSGILEFKNIIGYNKTVVVRYKRTLSDNLNSSDPAHNVTIGPGDTEKIQVVIKGRTGLEEDTDHDGDRDVRKVDDGKTNRDVYEIKGVYNLNENASGQIKQENFNLTFRNNNNELILIPVDDPFSRYEVNFETGILLFHLRQPFCALKDTSGEFIFTSAECGRLYDESLNPDKTDYTKVLINASFFRQVRSYFLEYNIVPGSVRVLVDGKQIRSSKYFVENFEGTLIFLDENDPYIGPETTVVVHYEYTPFGMAGQQGYVGGVRTEYQASRDILLGNTVMFNGQFNPSEAPQIGEAPTSKVVLEGDVGVDFNEERVTRLVNKMPLTDFDLLPVRVKGYAEYARTYFNPNTFGMALIDDMETSEDETIVDMTATIWQLTSPPEGYTQDGRARIRYRYYYDPDNPQRGLLPLDSDIESKKHHHPPYSAPRGDKSGSVPGPYNVAEGHLNISQVNYEEGERQTSMVVDFDFRKTNSPSPGNRRYVSVGTNISRVGKDFTTVNYIEFNAALIPSLNSYAPRTTSGILIHFDVGTINEDADGDYMTASPTSQYPGLDSEDQGYVDGFNNERLENDATEFNGGEPDKERDNIKRTEDRGFEFNFQDGSTTRVGAGPGIWNLYAGSGSSLSDKFPSTIGNGILNSEDWNWDHVLELNENVFTFDMNSQASGKLEGSSFLIHQKTKPRWTQFRFYINRMQLTEEEKSALTRVFAVRLWITPVNNNNNQAGRFLISNLRFAGSKWRLVKGRNDLDTLDSYDLDDPNIVRITNIDTMSSKDEYLKESFVNQERKEWEEIHGRKTSTEIKRIQESALKIEYDGMKSAMLREIMATRQFITHMDMSYYRKVGLWVNFREGLRRGDKLIFRVGSSDQDYLEYSHKADQRGWQKLDYELKMKKADAVIGSPNLRNISRLQIGVRNKRLPPQGEMWINDILVSDPIILQDDAYIYRSSVQITKPVYKTEGGIPIIGDLHLEYQERKKGADFSTIGQQASGMMELKRQFHANTQTIGRYWTTEYGYLYERTVADKDLILLLASKDGKTTLVEHSTLNKFAYVDNENVPVLTLGYKNRHFVADREEQIDEPIENITINKYIHDDEKTHTPSVQVDEKFPEFIYTNIDASYHITSDFYKKASDSHREKTIAESAKDSSLMIRQQDELQKGKININIGHLKISPSAEWGYERLLTQNKKDMILRHRTLDAKFYAPYFEKPTDFRYRTREQKGEVKITWQELWIFNPDIGWGGSYLENNFVDNDIVELNQNQYDRLKSATTTVDHSLSIPTNVFVEKPLLGFLQSFTPAYKREVTFTEQKLPFTAKTKSFNEDYGIKRTAPPLMDNMYNVVKYPYWHYYLNKNRNTSTQANARDYVYKENLEIKPPYEQKDLFAGYYNSLMFHDSFTTTTIFSFWDPLLFTLNTSVDQTAMRSGIKSIPSQEGRWTISLDQTYDLMKILNFWFWRPNSPGKDIHRSQFNFRYAIERQQLITQNKQKDTHTVEPSITFSWGYSSLVFIFGLDFVFFKDYDYITSDGPLLDQKIYKRITDIPDEGIKENDYTYRPGIKYITQFPWLRIKFEELFGIRLLSNPRYIIALEIELNRYDYLNVHHLPTLAYDLWSLRQTLDLNLHANLTGAIDFLFVYDIARNPISNESRTELIGMEIGIGLRILF
jgi:hypothetical protein